MSDTTSSTLPVLLKRLKLTRLERLCPSWYRWPEQQGWSYPTFLERLLAEEVAHRTEARIAQQLARAKFPFQATIETFDFTFRSDLKRQMLGRFLGPELVSDNRSLILEGPPGTGKTHLCIAMAYKAIQNGFIARFTTAAALINELRIATDLNEALNPYITPHVLVIDEMGYLGYGPGAAEILFQVVDQRYLKGRLFCSPPTSLYATGGESYTTPSWLELSSTALCIRGNTSSCPVPPIACAVASSTWTNPPQLSRFKPLRHRVKPVAGFDNFKPVRRC